MDRRSFLVSLGITLTAGNAGCLNRISRTGLDIVHWLFFCSESPSLPSEVIFFDTETNNVDVTISRDSEILVPTNRYLLLNAYVPFLSIGRFANYNL